jgi:hypothetical protein
VEVYAARGSQWTSEVIRRALRDAAAILSQCEIRTETSAARELAEDTDLDSPRSARLVEQLQPAKPAVFLVRESRHRPAFEAEAFGTGNTRRRPALAGTVWVTRHARDLPLVLAHELAHVLMDSGQHVDEQNNLMREETAPHNTALTPAQCRRMRERGAANGWLQPVK